MIITNSSQDYRITYQGLSLVENALGRPDLVQVSVSPDCTIMVAPQKDYGIDYLPNGEYRSWFMEGMNTKLARIEAHHIYARLNRGNNMALLLFSVYDYDIDGKINGEGEASEDYYYIKIGRISETDSLTDPTINREITIDFGYLTTPAGDDKNSWRDLFEVTVDDLIRPLKSFTSYIVKGTLSIVGKIILNDKQVTDIARQGDEGDWEPMDDTIPTTKVLMGKYLNEIRKIFLNKDREDSTDYVQTFKKGIKAGEYTSGALGAGGAVLIDKDGNSHAEFDFLNIRKKAFFTDVTVQELKHIGGELIISPASIIVSMMEETAEGYKCYFSNVNSDGKKIYNEFVAGDQGRCQTFNLETQENGQAGNRYWWRLVIEIGDDYVVFSKTDADTGSDIPAVGDNVSQLGNRTDKTRQNAQIYSAYGPDSPSRKMYQGIDSYSLEGKEVKAEYYDMTTGRFREVTYGDSYKGNRERTNFIELTEEDGLHVKGKVDIEQGSSGVGNFTDFPEEIEKAVKIGGENLLLNSGFTGNYDSIDLTANTELKSETELYSPGLEKWEGSGKVIQESLSHSGYACQVESIEQLDLRMITGEIYTVSLWAKGTTLTIDCSGTSNTLTLTPEYKRYKINLTAKEEKTFFRMKGDATVYEPKLERGTIATDWCPNVNDTPEVADRFKYLRYIQDALKGGTDILGGLILSTMIQLGKYTDGQMEKVNAGVSGIYNDDQDVAFWSGGTFEQAIATVQKLIDGGRPTDEEWKSMANFVATHGGDIFLRGYIYALGGIFRGTVYAQDGEFNGKVSSSINGRRIEIDPASSSIKLYDEKNRVCAEIAFSSNGTGGINYSSIYLYEYDNAGNLIFYSVQSGRSYFMTDTISNNTISLTPERIQFSELSQNIMSLSIGYNSNTKSKYMTMTVKDWIDYNTAQGKTLCIDSNGFMRMKEGSRGYTGEFLISEYGPIKEYAVFENGILVNIRKD